MAGIDGAAEGNVGAYGVHAYGKRPIARTDMAFIAIIISKLQNRLLCRVLRCGNLNSGFVIASLIGYL